MILQRHLLAGRSPLAREFPNVAAITLMRFEQLGLLVSMDVLLAAIKGPRDALLMRGATTADINAIEQRLIELGLLQPEGSAA